MKQDKIRGCLVAGAIGDALGYPVEFLKYKQIQREFGPEGIQSFDIDYRTKKADISDDTQMTLFTAEGILNAVSDGGDITEHIYQAYLDWLYTQNEKGNHPNVCKLLERKELYARRAPGITCLNALESGDMGTLTHSLNNSKGCGGIMRVAPLGLFSSQIDLKEAILLGARAAAITHSHPLGYIPSGFLSGLVYVLINQELSLKDAIEETRVIVNEIFCENDYINDLDRLIRRAVSYTENEQDDLQNLKNLGEGWVGEEALAVALYCALKYEHDFDKAITVSVNHDGDTDSTGAVTGNILGCIVGYGNISSKWKKNLECEDLIVDMADKLFMCRKESL